MTADTTDAAPRALDLPVEGMHCAGCVQSVDTLLRQVEGVEAVHVNFGTHRVRVEGTASLGALDARLSRGGYGLGDRETALRASVDVEAVKNLDGVLTVTARDDGWVVRHVDTPSVVEALRERLPEGVALTLEQDPQARRLLQSERAWRARFFLAAPLAAYLMLAAMTSWIEAPWDTPLAQAVFAALVVFGAGWPILLGGAKAVRHGRADMDVLIALGTLVAYGASIVALVGLLTGPLYFDASAMIMMFVCLGRWLEARARRSTGSAVDHLMRLEPDVALVLDGAGAEPREVPLSRVLVGDLVLVRPGARMPADGTVRSGWSQVDESLLTGESAGVVREAGDTVVAGATNGTGALEVEVTAVGGDTTLRRIAQWVERAQAQPAPVARIADRVAGVFVPVVLALAALTFLGWWLLAAAPAEGISAAIAVLVIACPCALGLATPVAIVVGTGRAAREGILIEGGAAIERAAQVRTVVFDKTGTLTSEAAQRITDIAHAGQGPQTTSTGGVGTVTIPEGAFQGDFDELMVHVAALERHSDHPLARAIVADARYAHASMPPARHVEVVPGHGIRGTVELGELVVGNATWFDELGIDHEVLLTWRLAASKGGASPLLVAVDGVLAGGIAVAHGVRPDARPVVDALREQGLEVRILSGDVPAVVAVTADKLGLPAHAVRGGVRPEEKASLIQAIPNAAMVGDGINDAPALASADVGIAVGGATDVAGAAAEIALLREDLHGVPDALALCRLILRTIRQNLVWAFGYNALAIPLAALGILPPMAAAAAMALSSVSVVLNSLRLRQAPLGPGTFSTIA